MAFLRRKLAAYRLFSVGVVTLDAKVFLKEDLVAKKKTYISGLVYYSVAVGCNVIFNVGTKWPL